MTGDGVNDAPALKRRTSAWRWGSPARTCPRRPPTWCSQTTTSPPIVAAVEEGRAIFANIRKFLRYLLSSNIGEVMTMFFGVLLAERSA